MRTFLVFFILAWLTGIACGFYQLSIFTLIPLALTAVYAAYTLRFSVPFYVAMLGLLTLGYIYGLSPRGTQHFCQLPTGAVRGVITQATLKEDKTQYVFNDDTGCTFLVFAPRFPEYLAGQRLQISSGTLQTPDQVTVEYQGYAEYLKRKNIDASWYQPVIVGVSNQASFLANWRQYIRNVVQTTFIEPDASLVSAMLFAEQGTIPEQFVRQFRDTGTTHVLAISGLNMSLIAGVIYLILLLLPLPKFTRALIASALVWAYIVFIGAPASVVRAGVFWTIALLAWHWQVLVSLPTIILLTALVMMSIYPPIIGDIGFQLSLAAIAGIGLIIFFTQKIRWQKVKWFWKILWSSVLISFGATLTTWPLVAYHFGVVSLISIIANIFIVPVVAPLLLISTITLLASLFTVLGASILAFGVHLLIKWMDVITFFLARVPGAVLNNVIISEKFILIYYLCLIAISMLIVKIQGRTWREIWQ